jgi:23S rRNA (adenine2503-C2)-methyltransferase
MSDRHLLDLTREELAVCLADMGEPAYRADQIWQAVFRDLASSYSDITTLPKSLRTRLSQDLPWPRFRTINVVTTEHGRTSKVLLELEDGETVESVAMRYPKRATACISTQVGCAMACRFCATGASGFRRQLRAGEIVAQVLDIARRLQAASRRLSNVVYMGMGEPLDNYDASLRSIRILNDERGFALGARSFTLSTVGIVPGIRRLAREPIQLTLAVSLHTADNDLRNELVPANRTYPVEDLLNACRDYVAATNRRITFEVALLAGVNDSDGHARRLAAKLRGLLCHVNLIPFNPVPGMEWRASEPERVAAFADVLQSGGVPASVRKSRGTEIRAGCGQLRHRTCGGDSPTR